MRPCFSHRPSALVSWLDYHGVSLMVPRTWSWPCVSRKGCGAETTPALVLRYNFAVKILASHVTVTRQTFLLGAEPEVGMSPICSKRYLFFFLAVLKFVAYFSSLCCQFFSFYAARALSHWRRIGPNLSFPSEFRMPWTF